MYMPAHGPTGRAMRWSARSFAAADMPGADLRDPAAALKLEKLLAKHVPEMSGKIVQ
jgi:hypothetical protein